MAAKVNLDKIREKLFTSKKKVLVTGGEGFIGTYLCELLGEQAIPWDKKSGNDIMDDNFKLQAQSADVIVHLAAELFPTDDEDGWQKNVLTTLRVLNVAKGLGIKVIMASTAGVYRDTGYSSQRETDPVEGQQPYGRSKVDCEYLCATFKRHIPIVVLRFFNVYGIGKSYGIVNKYLQGAREGKITINGDGTKIRDFIHVRDIVQVIKYAIHNKDMVGQTVNIGTGKGTTMTQLAMMFNYYSLLLRNTKLEIQYKDAIPGELKSSIADTHLLETLYPYPLTTNLEEDIKAMMIR